MKAKAFLKQLQKIDRMITNKLAEKEQWKAIATGTTASMDGERVQSSGSQQKMESAICRYIDIEKEIDSCIDHLIDTKSEVIRVIEQLDATEYDILHKIYVQYLTFDEVADAYGRSYSWITTMHGRALKNVQEIIDEKESGEDV